MSDPLRVGVVGLGRWGNTLSSYIIRTPGMKIATCFTRTPEKRRAFSEKFSCGEETSYEAVIERPDVDAVVIAAPNNKHAELAMAAAAQGKHVFVDKPIAASIPDAKKMIRACEEAGVTLAVGASSRWLRGHRLFKKMLDEGTIGTLAMAETNYSNDRGLHYTPDNWQWYAEGSPGGPLLQVAIHQVDNLLYLYGPIKRASAAFSKIKTKSEIPDVSVVWFEFESGLLGTLGTSFISPRTPNGRYTYFMNAYGDEANLYHDRWEGIKILRKDGEKREEIPYEEYPRQDYLIEEFEDFVGAVRDNRPPEVGGPEGLHVLGAVWAAMRSWERGEPVEVAEVLEEDD